jgi:hypothetical protein
MIGCLIFVSAVHFGECSLGMCSFVQTKKPAVVQTRPWTFVEMIGLAEEYLSMDEIFLSASSWSGWALLDGTAVSASRKKKDC